MSTQKTITVIHTITNKGDCEYKGKREEDVGMNIHERIVCLDGEMLTYLVAMIRDSVETGGDTQSALRDGRRMLEKLIPYAAEKALKVYRANDPATVFDGRELFVTDPDGSGVKL